MSRFVVFDKVWPTDGFPIAKIHVDPHGVIAVEETNGSGGQWITLTLSGGREIPVAGPLAPVLFALGVST